MSVISSSSSNDSLLVPQFSSTNSSLSFPFNCLIVSPGFFIFTTFNISNILLLLSLCVIILYHGLQQWRRRLSSSSTAAQTSHSDIFAYNVVIMELLSVSGSIVWCCGVYWKDLPLLLMGFRVFFFPWYGETFFHVLTCVEHYLAVVHPITYLSLKKERGVRIRNICIVCIWLFCFCMTTTVSADTALFTTVVCLLISSLVIISYCSLSVLCVLIRPGPGEQGRDRGRVDQSKKRAFYIILNLLGVLLLRCASNLTWVVIHLSNATFDQCVLTVCEVWINLPSALLLPLLFLHKSGMLNVVRDRIRSRLSLHR